MKKMISAKPKGFGFGRIGMAKSRSYEDRHFFGYIKTKSELRLTLGIVADGVGGGSFGERAAQITVDVIKSSIQKSMDIDLIQVIGKAIGAANRAVFFEAQEDEKKKGMSSTVVVAVIHEGKLYIANVGDSRVYLLRDGELIQLSVDHTWANDKIRSGVLDETRAKQHFNADAITRSIGFKADVVIDFGLYLQGGIENQNQAIGQQGLLLEKQDVILLCSDGLIKNSPMGLKQRYVSDRLIVDVLTGEHAEQAAKTLVDTAVGKNVDDNTTAVVMELPGREINFLNRFKTMLLWLGGVVVLGLAFLITLMVLGNVRGDLRTLEAAGAATVNAGQVLTQEASVFTATPVPTVVERKTSEIGTVINDSGRTSVLTDRMLLKADSFSNVFLGDAENEFGGELFLQQGSRVLFESIPVRTIEFVVFDGSQMMIQSGDFQGGARVHLEGTLLPIHFDLAGDSLMLLNYEGLSVKAVCLTGQCVGVANNGDTISVTGDGWTVIDLRNAGVSVAVIDEGLIDMWRIQVDDASSTSSILNDLVD